MGKDVDVSQVQVFGRNDCCTGRNVAITWYLGDSADYNYNTKCTNSPADITPPGYSAANPNCVASQPNIVTYVGTAVPTACFVPFSCTGAATVRGRFLQAVKPPGNGDALMLGEVQVIANLLLNMPTPRIGMASAAYGGSMVIFGGADSSGFALQELRLFDMINNAWIPAFSPIGTVPAARTGAFLSLLPSDTLGSPAYKFALFGGTSNAAMLNDVSLLQMPRCAPFLPSDPGVQTPLTCFHGGTVCYVYCQAFVTRWANGNPPNPVVCQPDGSWRGIFPACPVPAASAPQNVQASVNSQGAVTVSWLAPASTGYQSPPIDQYRVSSLNPNEAYDSFAPMRFPATAGAVSTGPGLQFAGGNWNSLLPKQGPCGQAGCPNCGAYAAYSATAAYPSWIATVAACNGLCQATAAFASLVCGTTTNVYVCAQTGGCPAGTAPSCTGSTASWTVFTFNNPATATGTPTCATWANPGQAIASNVGAIAQGVTNQYDFWNGYLRLNSDWLRNNKMDKMDDMILVRDLPAGMNVNSPWAFEAFVSLDIFNIISAVDHSVCIGIVNMADYGGYGAAEEYACVRNNGNYDYQIFQQNSCNNWNQDLFDTNSFNTVLSVTGSAYAAYIRYQRDPSTTPATWSAYFKFNQADAWIMFPTQGSEDKFRGGMPNAANLKPALIMLNANSNLRGVGLFSYVRVGPITTQDPGSQRLVGGALTSATIFGLTQQASYAFTVQAHTTTGGWGAVSAVTAQLTVPYVTPLQVLPLLSQGQPCTMNSVYWCQNADGSPCVACDKAFDGVYWGPGLGGTSSSASSSWPSIAHNNCDTDSQGGWIQVDLGGTRSVQQIGVFNRADCCTNRLNNFQVWVSTNTNFLATGVQCDPSMYNPLIQNFPSASEIFPCSRIGQPGVGPTGRYVTLRMNPLVVDCLNVAEFQVFGSPATALVSQNAACSSSSSVGTNTCQNAVDGRYDTYFLNSPAADANVPGAWMTVDMGNTIVVDRVVVFGRTDSLGMAVTLNNMNVWIGNMANFYSGGQNPPYLNAPCNATFVPKNLASLPGNTSSFLCVPNDGIGYMTKMNSMGRYITIQSATSALSIVEVQVYAANQVLVSFERPCFMSSTWNPYYCSNAFNNKFDDFSHTNADSDNYITVDLGFSTAVASFQVTDRKDCCQYRLNYASFYVGDSPNYHQNYMCPKTYIPQLWENDANNGFQFGPQYVNAGTNGWQYTFACALTGRYATMHILPGQYMNVAEIQVFAQNACPIRTAFGATQGGGSVCAGAGYGQICSFACNPGWVVKSGALSSTCNGNTWDQPQLVCAPPCPDLVTPAYAQTCQQTYFFEDFNTDGGLTRFISLEPYQQKLAIPSSAPPQNSKWFQLDGVAQASSFLSGYADLHMAISSQRIYSFQGSFTLSAAVRTKDRAGVFFRALDRVNMMRFWFDVTTGQAALQRIVNGVAFNIDTFVGPIFTSDEWHVVSVSVAQSSINVTVDNQLILMTQDRTYLVGYAGVYSQTQAYFDNVQHSIACGASCSGMTDQDTCTFSCQQGLLSVGPLVRTCVGNTSVATMAFTPDPVANPLSCTLPSPTFLPATLYVLENAPVNSPVGDPLVASSTSPNYQVQFQILNVFQAAQYTCALCQNASKPGAPFNQTTVANQALFWVDVCSGQVKLRTGGSGPNSAFPDFEGVNQYILTMRVFVNGFPTAQVVQNVSVFVLNQDEPPTALSTAVTLKENAALSYATVIAWASRGGTVVGAQSQWDPENSTVAYALAVDGSAGSLLLNSTTGAVYVAATVAANGTNASSTAAFNFEVLPNVLSLSVTVTQKNDSTMTSTGAFSVTLLDQNDPPLIRRNQAFTLSQYAMSFTAAYTTLAGTVVATDEDKNPLWNNGVNTFNLLQGYTSQTFCGQTGKWPSTTGAITDPQLFAIDPSTGAITLQAAPANSWTGVGAVPMFVAGGQLVRADYQLCVQTIDVGGASDAQPVEVYILADITTGPPVILSVAGLTPSPPTSGGTNVTFTGSNFVQPGSTAAQTVITANFSSAARAATTPRPAA